MGDFARVPEGDERIAAQVVDAAIRVHTLLGPGLLESVYETCLCHELGRRGVPHASQVTLPVVYDGVRLDAGLRLDLLVGDRVIVEVKATEKMLPLYEAQLLTYLKLSGLRLGLLMNFNTALLKDGIKRMVL
jgi:GxxExxY protein